MARRLNHLWSGGADTTAHLGGAQFGLRRLLERDQERELRLFSGRRCARNRLACPAWTVLLESRSRHAPSVDLTSGELAEAGHRDLLRLAQAGHLLVVGPVMPTGPPGRTPAGTPESCGSARRPGAWPGPPPPAWSRPRAHPGLVALGRGPVEAGARRGHRARGRWSPVHASAMQRGVRARPGPRGQRPGVRQRPGGTRPVATSTTARRSARRDRRRFGHWRLPPAWSSAPPYDTSVRPPG